MSQSSYELDSDFECLVVNYLINSRKFFLSIAKHLDPKKFADPSAQLLVQVILQKFNDTGSHTRSMVIIKQKLNLLLNDGKIKQSEIDACVDFVDRFYDISDDTKEDEVKESFIEVLKSTVQDESIEQLLKDSSRKKSPTQAIKKLVDIQNVGENKGASGIGGVGQDMFEMLKSIPPRRVLPSWVPDLDFMLSGGFKERSLTTFMAPTGVGKSMTLSHMAAVSILSGHSTCIASIEVDPIIWYERLLASLTGVPIEAISEKVALDVAYEKAQKLRLAPFTIEYFSPGTNFETITDWVSDIEEKEGKKHDTIIIDYGDLLSTSKLPKNSTETHHRAKYVWESMHVYANENEKWLFTASQSKNKTVLKGVSNVGADAASGSSAKGHYSHYFISMDMDLEKKEELQVSVVKNRYGGGGGSIPPFNHHYECGRLCPIGMIQRPSR
jgi:KaiC/GvpD/RAD55 family RecA-like ATPase